MSFHPSLVTPQAKAKKMMLWFSMISMTMMFAGLTSAYVVSKARPDWLENFNLPSAFYTSTFIILASSLTFWLAFKAVKVNNTKTATAYSLATLVLAVLFAFFQWIGFRAIVDQGFYFTGAEST